LDPSEHHLVYVTDYTGSQGLREVRDSKCPVNLSKMTLCLDMWSPEAAELGRNMKPTEFYRLGNTRLKLGTGNDHIEGIFKEIRHAKKLDDDDFAVDEKLEALIVWVMRSRRCPWMLMPPILKSPGGMEKK
jgi:hypothetical protein